MPTKPERTIGFIWPKDPRPANPPRWPRHWRFLDVLCNKGPDIFVGTLDGPNATPHTARWSRWQDLYGHPDDGDEETRAPFPGADRGLKRYDFRTRKYKIPDEATWSYVQYCDDGKHGWRRDGIVHEVPQTFWDVNGAMYPAWVWHDLYYGPDGNYQYPF